MIDLKEVANNLSDEKIIKLVTDLGADRYIDKEDCIIIKKIKDFIAILAVVITLTYIHYSSVDINFLEKNITFLKI